MTWDWDVVGELAVGIAVGMGVGGWFASACFANAGYRLMAHPTARKLASAAEKLTGGNGGGWAGVAGQVVSGLFGKKPPEE